MKIAIYYNELFLFGGVEKQITKRCEKLNNLGHDVTVIYNSINSSLERMLEISKYANVIKYEYQLQNHYDIAIYDAIYNLKKVNADKYIQVLNGNLIDGKEQYDTNINFDTYIAVSQDCANQFKERTGKEAIVIPNLIDTEELLKLSKQKVKLDKADITLLVSSRIDQMKGFNRLELIIKEFEKRKVNYKVYILGNNHIYNGYAEQLKREWKKYNGVEFIGYESNPYKYMKKADYLVQLSDYESQCMAIHESLIIGTPVITTDFKTAVEIVTDNNGIVLKKDMSNLDIDKILKKDFKVNFNYPDYFELWKKELKPIEVKDKKFTILIPNFNNGRYLEKCINSILNQTYKNYEIIFVDDMSTDNSVEIAKELLKNHKIIVNKSKRYNGGTRNVGILEANSDYIICIDSDDWLKDDKVLDRINKAIKNEDILFLEYNMYKNGKEIILAPTQEYKTQFEAMCNPTCAIWTKVVKTKLLKDTLFDEGNLMEDKIHHMRLCYKMNSWKLLSGATHIWNRDNSKSTSTERNYKWNNSAYRHIAEYLDFYNEVNDNQIKEWILSRIRETEKSIKEKTYQQH